MSQKISDKKITIAVWLHTRFRFGDFLCTPILKQMVEDLATQYVFFSNHEEHGRQIAKLNAANITWLKTIFEDVESLPLHLRLLRKFDKGYLYHSLRLRFARLKKLPHWQVWLKASESKREEMQENFLLFKGWQYAWFPFLKSNFFYKLLYNFRHKSTMLFDRKICATLKLITPNLLILGRTHTWETMYFTKAAYGLGIPVVGLVSNWAHPTTLAPMARGISKLLVASRQMKQELMERESIEPDTIVTVGDIQKDLFNNDQGLCTKEQFMQRLKLPINAKLITIGTNKKGLKEHEASIAKYIAQKILQDTWNNCCLYIQAHFLDKDWKRDFQILEESGRIVVRNTCQFTGDLDGYKQRRLFFKNLILHSDIIIQSRGALALDAIALDKPVISLGFDGGLKIAPNDSVIHNYRFLHFKPIIDLKGSWFVKNFKELHDAITCYLLNPKIHKAGRQAVRELCIEPYDGQSSNRTFSAIKECSMLAAARALKPEILPGFSASLESKIDADDSLIKQYMFNMRCGIQSRVETDSIIKNKWRNWQEVNGHQRKVYVFGAGRHTEWLFHNVKYLPGPQVVAILDDNAEQGRKISDFSIIRPSEANVKEIDSIIISTDTFPEKMINRCKECFGNNIQYLYPYNDNLCSV